MTYLKERGYEARVFYLNVLYLVLLVLGALAMSTLNAELFLDKEIAGAPTFVDDGNGTLVQNGTLPSITLSGGGEGTGAPRYRRCYVGGTQKQYGAATTKGCIAIAGAEDADGNFVPEDGVATEQLATMDTLNGIVIAILVFNVIVGIHSVIMHLVIDPKKSGAILWHLLIFHFDYQFAISMINVGLFSGLLGLLNSVTDIQSDVNVANNLYYSDVNLYLVGVAGVVIATLDLIGSNMIVYCLCTADKGYMCNPK